MGHRRAHTRRLASGKVVQVRAAHIPGHDGSAAVAASVSGVAASDPLATQQDSPAHLRVATKRAALDGGTAQEWLDAMRVRRESSRAILGDHHPMLHFTSREHAERIVAEGGIETSATIDDAVYAVAVGGENSPGVQTGSFGRLRNQERDVAVLFVTDEMPEDLYPEEAIWRRDEALPIRDAVIVSREEAQGLLDGSAGIPEPW